MFYTNKENNDYLNFSTYILYVLMVKKNTPKKVLKEISLIHSKVREYEKENKWSIGEMTISKDSVLGHYVIESNDSSIFKDLIISYSEITNAFNISIFEDNPISKDIFPLFKNQVSGNPKSLSEKYDENVINYILNNNDFKYYLDVINGTYEPKEYMVYENSAFTKKKLVQNVKELKLKRNEK